MARKPRNQPKAEFHHITNRGARRSDIYLDDIDRDLFLHLLGLAHAKFGVVIHAFALMGNHYHVIVQFPDRNMSQVMHWIGMCYATAINRRYGYDGRLCKDRFYNSPIDSEPYLMSAVRYVHQNPKDIGITELDEYRWSSFGMYLDLAPTPEWMQTDLLLGLFGNDLASFRLFNEATPSISFGEDDQIAG